MLLFAYSFGMFRISSASSKSFFYCNPALMRFCLLVRFVLVLLYSSVSRNFQLGSGSPKLAQRGGANTLDTGSAAAAAGGVDGAAVAEGRGEAKRSEGGDLNANDKGVDGENSSGKRVREEEKSGVDNESKISNLIQSSQPRRRVSCLRHGKAHRPNIDTTQLERHRRAVWSASEVHILEEGLATYISPRIPKGDAATRMDKWSDENGTRIHASTDPHSVDEPTWRVA
eukprot:COSAG02_NODE_662_length_18752_cov_10.146464_1_plen_227_part_10